MDFADDGLEPPLTEEELALKPKTRGDCKDGIRPCPWVSCKHHLFRDTCARAHNGHIDLEHLQDPTEMSHTCVLDFADQGGNTLEEVGEVFGTCRERMRQVEDVAVRKRRRLSQSVYTQFAFLREAPEALQQFVMATGRMPESTRALWSTRFSHVYGDLAGQRAVDLDAMTTWAGADLKGILEGIADEAGE